MRVTGVAQLLSSVTETNLFNHELGPIDLAVLSQGWAQELGAGKLKQKLPQPKKPR